MGRGGEKFANGSKLKTARLHFQKGERMIECSHMNAKVIAVSPEAIACRFGTSFYAGSKTQPELDERVQLGEFLQSAAHAQLLKYPVAVSHTRDCKPDFKMTLGSVSVGVEATKVANHELEWARGIQRQYGLGRVNTN